MIKRIFIIFSILIYCITSLSGQQFYTQNYNINDGLPDNCISSIYKDSQGFLWIGTQAGLAHFDGKNFKIYSSLDGLAGNEINSIAESDDGTIWFGCHKVGISKFDGKKFTSLTSNDGLINNNVTKLFFCQSHKLLLIGTSDGLSVYDGNSFISFHISLNNVQQRIHVTGFLSSNKAIYVLTLSSGLYKFLPETRELIRVNADNKLNANSLFAAHITSNNDTLVSINRKGFKVVNNKTNYYETIGQVECFASNYDSTIWIGSWQNNNSNLGGLYKLKNNKLTKYNVLLGIDSEKIRSLLFDINENILWVGTEDNGLYMFPGEIFTYYSASFFNHKKLSISDLLIDNNKNLWILNAKSVIKKLPNDQYKIFDFNLFQEKFTEFKETELKQKYQYLIDKEGSYEKYQSLIEKGIYRYSNPYIKLNNTNTDILRPRSLYKPNRYDIILEKTLYHFTHLKSDIHGNIWVGSNTGIFKIDRFSNEIEYFDLEGNYFTHFAFGKENELIITSWNNALIYPGFEKNPRLSQNHYSIKHSPLKVNRTKSFNNKIWFLNDNHDIFLYDNFHFHILNMMDSAIYHSINDICFDYIGNIIIGGNDGVVYILGSDENNLTVKYKISKQNGLSGTNIKWLNCTKEKQLYVGTNTGISIINLDKLYLNGNIEIEKLDKTKGFTDYTGTVSVCDYERNLWIGTNGQLIKINTSDINFNKSKAFRFLIKSIEINDEPYSFSGSEPNQQTNVPERTIILPWYKNSITFNYDAIKFIDSENIRFVYTLQNGKKTETKETRDRKLVLQNLKSGDYIFKINAISENGIDLSSELTIHFIIKQAFWKFWWVILLFTLFIVLLVWIIIRTRTNRIKQRERKRVEIAEKITEFELKALRAQMNPHFIFNAINSIQNYMLSNDVDAALNYLSDFAKLIRITLENVSKKMVTIEEELSYIKYYLRLEQMRFDKKFNTQINLASDIDCNKIMIPPMIIQPYIENAIKHGLINTNEEGKLKVEMFILSDNSEQFLHCIIEDNGVGRKKSGEIIKNNQKSYTSKGTYITNERIILLNQTHHRKGFHVETTDLYDQNNLPNGTRVEIIFPI